ncbi:MAG: tripartite tricarboxylate transporter substrate binding protein [Pseudolabrys sp.]
MSAPAQAQSAWPTQAVRIILSVPPGGGTDATARMMEPGVSKALGVPVVLESKTGAGGIVASQYVSHANPDGYTIGLFLSGHAANMVLNRTPPYDLDKDFTPISLLARWPNLIVVHPSVPANNLAELVALAKEKPGSLSYGTPGIGLSHHLGGELLKLAAGINILHVPYRGGAPALNDVLGGHIPVAITALNSGAPFVTSGKLRAMAVTGSKRSILLPDVPTVAESGYPGYDVSEWAALVGPPNLPAPIVKKLQAAFVTAMNTPDINDKLRNQAAYEVIGSTPEELRDYLHDEVKRVRDIVERAHIPIQE